MEKNWLNYGKNIKEQTLKKKFFSKDWSRKVTVTVPDI